VSLSSYRGSKGYLGNGIAYATSDKSHYQSYRIAYFNNNMMNRGGDFFLDGELINSDEQSFFIKEDATIQPIDFSIEDYETSTGFSSEIVGILGPIPYFKDYQIETPKDQIKSKLSNLIKPIKVQSQ